MKLETPIYDFITKVNKKNPTRFFMPGHKGNPASGFLQDSVRYDITEIKGADALFEAGGIIGESEKNAAGLFGAKATCYSTQGSTLCIQAMVRLMSRRGDIVIAGRNAHMSFIHACTLLRMKVVWLLPEETDEYGLSGTVTAEQVRIQLKNHSGAAGVYITSPDYLGNTADIAGISQVCRAFEMPLFCDNAHGAYLGFTANKQHPLRLGADICCDSAHKTLPVLTGGAYLHLAESCEWEKEDAKAAMLMFASTSPSYLILSSLDLCNRYLAKRAEIEYVGLERNVILLKHQLSLRGWQFLPNPVDFAKLTIAAQASGWDGVRLSQVLRQEGMECEYANQGFVVLMISSYNSNEDFEKLRKTMSQLSPRQMDGIKSMGYQLPVQAMDPFEADKLAKETVEIKNSIGRIAAETIAGCPPGVPVVIGGERINEQIKNICQKSRKKYIKVLK